nr:MAG TPA: hypothetical protein [Caudoviricetes sp.]
MFNLPIASSSPTIRGVTKLWVFYFIKSFTEDIKHE